MNLLGGLFGRRKGDWDVVRDKDGTWSYWLHLDGFTKNDEYLKWSLENPVLFAVIAAKAKLYSQMHITVENVNTGEEVKDNEYLKLLYNPNYFQSKNDFFYQQSWFLSATGNDLIYQIRPFLSDVPKAIYNLIPSDIDYKKINKVKKFITSKQDIIDYEKKSIEYKLDGQTYDIKVKDIIPLYDVASGLKSDSFMKSPSRVSSITKNLCNIEENLLAANMNLKMSQKFLARNKNSINGMPGQVKEDDRDSIEKVLKAKSIQITNGDIEVQHLVSDLKRLYLNEQFAHEATVIANAFELNRDFINYSLNGASTHNNQDTGIIRVIQTTIQADADNTMNSFTNSWGLNEKGLKFKASYSHLPIMQTLINSKIETFNKFQEGIKTAIENQTMSVDDAKKATEKLRKDLGL